MSLPLLLISWTIVALSLLLGLRLARAALRSRSLPEGLMAAFFFGGSTGYAVLMLRPTLGLPPESAGMLYSIAGAFFLLPGTTVVLFTWKVFRPEAAWARGVALSLATLTTLSYVLSAWLAAPLGLEDVVNPKTPGGFFWGSAAIRMGCFGWACVEASLFYARSRRRVALGLTNAVVSNRFFLWAIWSGGAALMVAFRVTGRVMLIDAGPDAVQPLWLTLSEMVVGLSCSGAFWLTFAAPRAYQRWLEAATGD